MKKSRREKSPAVTLESVALPAGRRSSARASRKSESMAISSGTGVDRSIIADLNDRGFNPAGTDSYFGGKGLCFRHLVNQIPPHEMLIVPFAGHCAVTRNIRLPEAVRLVDLDPAVFEWWNDQLRWHKSQTVYAWSVARTAFEMTHGCGIQFLEEMADRWGDFDLGRAFVYVDPPYLQSTRKSGTRYRYDMSEADHSRLLNVVRRLKCRVMISGYGSALYHRRLQEWRSYSFQAVTRNGLATEWVWCNYPEPAELQDYRYLGADHRERFKLQRRVKNLISKLNRLPQLERMALLDSVHSHFGVTGRHR